MKIIDCEQYSPEWYQARVGLPTASDFDRVVNLDGKVSAQYKKYMLQLAGERILGMPEATYQSADMLRGKQMEAEAREFYSLITGQEIRRVGFCLADNGSYGCSPDGMIGKDELLEIKCPKISTHIEYLLANKLPSDYWQQTQGQLLVTGYKRVTFLSYYPGLPPLIVKVEPDKVFQKHLKSALAQLCADIEETVKKIKR